MLTHVVPERLLKPREHKFFRDLRQKTVSKVKRLFTSTVIPEAPVHFVLAVFSSAQLKPTLNVRKHPIPAFQREAEEQLAGPAGVLCLCTILCTLTSFSISVLTVLLPST